MDKIVLSFILPSLPSFIISTKQFLPFIEEIPGQIAKVPKEKPKKINIKYFMVLNL